jgi:hypothetical protein
MHPRSHRRTRPGRLSRLDRFVLDREGERLARGGGVIVDLGIGGNPWTTEELADAVAPLGLAVVGVDHDPELVAHARVRARPGLGFVQGSFDLPDEARPALLVRAMNVLRDYGPAEVAPAHRRLGEALVDGGLLVEGSCGASGEVLCAWLVRKVGADLVREGLLFSTDFSRGFGPLQFRDRLPRDLRGTVRVGTPLGDLFAAWTAAVDASGTRTAGARFLAGALRLCADRDDIEPTPHLWPDGFLVWRPSGGI